MVWCRTLPISARKLAHRGWLFLHRHMPRIHTTPSHHADGWRVILYAWLPIMAAGILCLLRK